MDDNQDNRSKRRRLDPNETRIIDASGGAAGAPQEPYQPIESQRSGYIPRVPRSQPDRQPREDLPTAAVPEQYYGPPREGTPSDWPVFGQGAPNTPPVPNDASGYIPVQRPAQPQPAPRHTYIQPGAPEDPPPFTQPVPRRGQPVIAPGSVQPVQTRSGSKIGLLFGVLLGLVVLALLGSFAYAGWYEQQYAGRIYPGVQVLGQDIGGMDSAAAQAAIESKVAEFTNQPVVLLWEDKEWKPNPEQLGLRLNVDRTVDAAFAVGRDQGLIENWTNRFNISSTGYVVPLSASIDERAVQEYLEAEVAPQIDLPVQQGEVWLQGEQINKTDAQTGYKLRTFDALSAISQGLATMSANRVDLPVDVLEPTVSQAELDATYGQLSTLLSGPISAKYGDKVFTIERSRLSQKVLQLKRSLDPNAAKHYEVTFQEDNIKAIIEDWSTDINIGPQSARFDWNGGNLRVIKESSDGVKVEEEKAIEALKAALNTVDARTFDLPVAITPPSVSSKDIDKLGIKQLLATGNSAFVGSTEARATNITVAANHLHGAVIPPGEEFSFLDTLGPITTDRGFVEGYVIQAERTQKGVGGGVCQVSTTAFRAAFWAGLDITVRAPHAYRVSWYESKGEPVGFDAAVFDPGVDFRFINDTPGYLLVQTWITDQELNIGLFGTPIADEVKLSGPEITNRLQPPPDVYQIDPTLPAGTTKQVETARQGLDTGITRQIIKDGQVIHQETFNSHYEAWPNWYMVAPDVQTPSTPLPAATPTPGQ